MIRLIWFIAKFVALIALAVWLADHPGEVRIVWNDYLVQTSASFLLVFVLALVAACLGVYKIINFLRYGHRGFKMKRKLRRQELGLYHLTHGFAALAGGDAAEAGKKAVAARKFLGQSQLAQWLQAQAAQLAGDQDSANRIYAQISKDVQAAPIGYRGLIAAAIRRHRYDEAAARIEEFAVHHPRSPWLNLARYDVAARRGAWAQAASALQHVSTQRLLDKPESKRQQAAVMIAEARAARAENQMPRAMQAAEQAQRLMPDWLPARIELVRTQAAAGYSKLAVKKIEKFWAATPHPELGAMYRDLTEGEALKRFKKVEDLVRQAPDHPESLMLLAEAALAAELWGEARRNLNRAAALAPTRRIYALLAQLDKTNADARGEHDWLEKAATAPVEAAWLCRHCGHQTPQWEITCPSCAAMNDIDWADPYAARPVEAHGGVSALDV